MSVRYEWYGIDAASQVELLAEGDELGDGEVDTEVALVFSGNEGGVLAGSVEDLRAWLTSAVAQLDEYQARV